MAITLKPARPVTDEELLELSKRNPGYQFERTAKGDLVVTPTGSESAHREAQLAKQLRTWADRDRRGLVFSSAGGFRLPDGALHAPDASWVRRDRWVALSPEERRGIAPLCPDAVFEIRPESQSPDELREKISIYVANGARLAVLIDPARRTVEVYRAGREPVIHTDPGSLALDPELPAFVLDLGPLFEP